MGSSSPLNRCHYFGNFCFGICSRIGTRVPKASLAEVIVCHCVSIPTYAPLAIGASKNVFTFPSSALSKVFP